MWALHQPTTLARNCRVLSPWRPAVAAHKRAAPVAEGGKPCATPLLRRRRVLQWCGKKRHLPVLSRPHRAITCNCGEQAYLMRRTLHPKIKGEIWTFECKDCGKQTEKACCIKGQARHYHR